MRVTTQHLHNMMERLTRSMHAHGLIGEGDRVLLEHGSKVNGQLFRLSAIVDGRRTQPFGSLSFGFTKQACFDTMHTLSVALEVAQAA